MSVYICRWPNGDLSLACGTNRVAIEDVLDEVGNPDSAELIPIKHAVAVHFHLKQKIESTFTVPDCLEFEGIDERLFSEVCEAYPLLDEVLVNEDATPEQIDAAVENEKARVRNELPFSDDPSVEMVQRLADMPKRLAEHHKAAAKAIISKKV